MSEHNQLSNYRRQAKWPIHKYGHAENYPWKTSGVGLNPARRQLYLRKRAPRWGFWVEYSPVSGRSSAKGKVIGFPLLRSSCSHLTTSRGLAVPRSDSVREVGTTYTRTSSRRSDSRVSLRFALAVGLNTLQKYTIANELLSGELLTLRSVVRFN